MSNKKQVINIEEEPIDQVEHFMARNFKKLLVGILGLFIVFILSYTFMKLNKSRTAMAANKVGTLELDAMMSGNSTEKVKAFAASASEYSAASDYIKLRAAELLADKKDYKDVKDTLASSDGDLKELSDSLKYDTGADAVDPKSYIGKGDMGSLWYYRAILNSTGAERNKLMTEFAKNYPNSELLKQLKRWNS